MTTIALSALPGTVDRRFTTGLAKALDLDLVDLRPLETNIARKCDSRTRLVQRWVGGQLFSKASLSHRELTRRLREEILALAGRDNILIVSWSASVVLHDTSRVAQVAIRGHRALRERNASASLHYAEAQSASFEVASEDALIEGFIWQTFGVDWQDGSLYDLVIDAGGPAKEQAAEALRTLLAAPRFHPPETTTIYPPPRPVGHAQSQSSPEGAFERSGKLVIDRDIVSLSGVDSHEDAVAKVEKRMRGCCDKATRLDPFLPGS